ncbi:MAG: PQQ-binding-like beta-propeller repeat protein [Bacteroidetes bacterium]|nr:PQQ-binding-like beta-propeller repeat protein [Bacteroidota bacterium]
MFLQKKSEQKNQDRSGQREPRPLWPGVLIVAIQWLVWFIIPLFLPEVMMVGVFVGFLGNIVFFVWWLFFSRRPVVERWGAFVLILAALAATFFLLDESISTGNMGLQFILYSPPVMCLGFIIWAVATRHMALLPRRVTMLISIMLASGIWIFLRSDGLDGAGRPSFSWRWAETQEERLLAQSGEEESIQSTGKIEAGAIAEWPGFRGTNRDGIVSGIQINTDWSKSPPVEMWRRAVGPGCSSFAVLGNLLYTQEQRGEYEVVSCYNLNTGEPVWKHRDEARFYDSHAGAGPRATPAISGGRVYTLGATGIINALDAGDGSVIWSNQDAKDTFAEDLYWAFAGSPLVVDDLLIVSLSGKLLAYDITNGKQRWSGPDGGNSYSSPQLLTIEGVPQVLLMSKSGAISLEPESGKQLWDYPWEISDRILQPALINNSDLLLTREINELRRLRVSLDADQWSVEEQWTSSEVKFNFNDMLVHDGHAYGFDGPYLVCVDLNDGKRIWKGDRYRGWLLLLADQDLILVLSEKGELALVEATPEQFTELSRIKALHGKTWNHPALAGNIILVRNSSEMAAFRLPQ